jgi:quinol monooxygenase YgiN
MENFVLVVELQFRPEDAERFHALIAENARQSVANEPGCLQFDVVKPDEGASRVLLYEVYADRAAFDAHTKMPHVAAFFAAAKPMILAQSATRCGRLAANRK